MGLYLDPPEKALVLCVAKSPRFRLSTVHSRSCRCSQGTAKSALTITFVTARRPSPRLSTSNLGASIGSLHKHHRAKEFLGFLRKIDSEMPGHLDVHLILDNYQTHKVPAVRRWLVRNPRFHLHVTPTYSSWINLVERWFAALTDKALRRAAHRSVKSLEQAIKLYIDVNNEDPKPLVWTKTADEVLA